MIEITKLKTAYVLFAPVYLELGKIKIDGCRVRYFVRKTNGLWDYPVGVQHCAYSRSYILKRWDEMLKQAEFVTGKKPVIAEVMK